jgi:branched-chain amino acid transport system substrate-binding protein
VRLEQVEFDRGGEIMKRHGILAFAAGALLSWAATAQEPIKIGFIGELSGPQGALGQDMYDAFMLVVERNGGRLGGAPVRIIKKDSQLKPEVANQIVDELIEREKVPIITGITFSNIMMAIYRKVVEKEVFLIGSNASPSPIAGAQCNPFYFQVAAQNDQRAEAMGRYAASKGYKRVYAMAPNYQAGKDFIDGFKREYKQPLLGEVYTPLNQLDFQAELVQLTAAKPDAVYVFYPGGLGVQFVRQWQQSGLHGKIPLLSTSTVDGINLPALKEAAIGVAHASLWGPDFDNPESKRFVEEFEKRYNRLPSEYGATAYDSALVLDAAIRTTKGSVADKKAFMAALKSATFPTVRGRFKWNHNQLGIQDFYVFEVFKDAKGRYSHRTVAKVMADAADAYHAKCPMK